MDQGRRVSYICSKKLIEAADRLPSNIGRASTVHELVQALDLLEEPASSDDETVDADDKGAVERNVAGSEVRRVSPRAKVVRPDSATRAQLLAFHDAKYVDILLGNEVDTGEGLTSSDDGSCSAHSSDLHRHKRRRRSSKPTYGLEDDCPAFDRMSEYVTEVAGASIKAARELRTGAADVAIAWTGGRHHGRRGEAAGFCYVQDVVLAILELRKPNRRPKQPRRSPSPFSSNQLGPANPQSASTASLQRNKKILYIDIDLHHGDGVETAFFTSPDILTISLHLHSPGFFPATGSLISAGPANSPAAFHALNVALESGLSSINLLRIFDSCVEPIAHAFQPDAVVLQSGCDGLAGDPCNEWNLDLEGMGEVVKRVLSWGKKTLLLGGGGYNNANAARCWSYLTAIALDRNLPLETEISSEVETYSSFAPSFSLDVPAGARQDKNTDQTLARIEAAFRVYASKLVQKYSASSAP